MADYYTQYNSTDTSQEPKKIKLVPNPDGTYSISVAPTSESQDYTLPLNFDAWGRNKVVQDYSLFSGVFTYNIPSEKWVKYKNGLEDQTIEDTPDFYRENSKGIVNSNGGSNYLMGRRHPRYQPNRGHLYSSSMLLPNKNALSIRRFGIFNKENGAFFELINGELYAVIRSKYIDILLDENSLPIYDEQGLKITGEAGSPDEVRMLIDTTNYDLEKGNIYDIQMQWRGVGNIKFFINLQLIHTFEFLGALSQLSISNPALPAGMEAANNGEDASIECGCVDITSEGGSRETRFYKTVDSDEVTISTAETAVLAIRIPELYNGDINTRDIVLTRIGAYANVNSILKVYYTRDVTAITANWFDIDSGFQEKSINGDITSFDINKMKKLSTRRIPENGNVEIENPDRVSGDFYLIYGDYILITVKGKNASEAGAFVEFSEEI